MSARVVRRGYTVHYNHRAYAGGMAVEFTNEDEIKRFEHQLEPVGKAPSDFNQPVASTHPDAKPVVTPSMNPPTNDSSSIDARRKAEERVTNPEKAAYDDQMQAMSQDLAHRAHPEKAPAPKSATDPIPVNVEVPKEIKGAPLTQNFPDDSKSKKETSVSKPGGQEAEEERAKPKVTEKKPKEVVDITQSKK